MIVDLLLLDVMAYNSADKAFYRRNVAIKDGRFFYIGDKGAETFHAREVLRADNRYMIPGLIDIHLHIESSMITPLAFSSALLKNGVTTVVEDAHEIANVFGLRGILEMMKASENCMADIFFAIPSSVPSTSFELETTGGEIDIAEIDELMKDKRVICLGEVMNYADLIANPEGKTNRILKHVREKYPHLPIEGHCPKLLDLDLCRFIYAGIDSDHTHQTVAGMEERIRLGMFVEIQEKSMTREIMDYLIENDRSEHFCFVTDDVMPDYFLKKGHLNHLLKKAIQMGMKPELAIYAGTFTPARRMKMTDRGTIAPNKIADFVLLGDLPEFEIEQVYKKGVKVYDARERTTEELPRGQFPADFYQSVQLGELSANDFVVRTPGQEGIQPCRIIIVSDGMTFTKEHIDHLPVRRYELQWEESPYCLIAVFERYGKNGNRAYGLVGGDVIKRGALATTYAHDNHNLMVVGKCKRDMEIAANTVIRQQGGICAVENGEVIASLPLPVGGILSEAPLDEIAREMSRLRQAMIHLGYRHYNPIMSFSTLSLPVSPELKITDRGLVKANEGKLVSLFVS